MRHICLYMITFLFPDIRLHRYNAIHCNDKLIVMMRCSSWTSHPSLNKDSTNLFKLCWIYQDHSSIFQTAPFFIKFETFIDNLLQNWPHKNLYQCLDFSQFPKKILAKWAPPPPPWQCGRRANINSVNLPNFSSHC